MSFSLPDSRPSGVTGLPVGSYDSYDQAQRAVDHLSDNKFPVENVTIVGTDLRLIERVTGRLTYPRAALAGAATGAWFGLLIGLLLGLFTRGGQGTLALLAAGVLYGAGFGAIFGLVSYALTGGRRDFTSTRQIVAGRYEVLCAHTLADQARDLLAKLALRGQ